MVSWDESLDVFNQCCLSGLSIYLSCIYLSRTSWLPTWWWAETSRWTSSTSVACLVYLYIYLSMYIFYLSIKIISIYLGRVSRRLQPVLPVWSILLSIYVYHLSIYLSMCIIYLSIYLVSIYLGRVGCLPGGELGWVAGRPQPVLPVWSIYLSI